MELQIPQSFKVQWLNTTLKFIKDDTQLVKDYPQMPSSHVEYLHNLIWQRKNNVGLGFKSLYSPVWEAMKIYSVKYQFKIVVEKSEDGMSGHLIMEKIPKTGKPTKKLDDVKEDKKNCDEKKELDNKTIQNFVVTKKLQADTMKCKQPETQPLKKTKTKKPVPKVSKTQKMLMENQNILDSLSPLFVKTMLKTILDFLTDKLSASKIFSNLAPVESRFLENFLSIYQRKDDLEVLLSPACNEILTEISKCFDDFNKTCCLEISCVGVNSNTNKREIKYTKVPVFPTTKKTKQKLKENVNQTKTSNISSNDNKKFANIPCISKEEYNMMEENVLKETKKHKTKILQNNEADKVIETIDNNVLEATFEKKTDVKPKTNTYLKDTSVNKSVLLPKKSISLTNEGTSSTTDIASNKVEKNSPKMKTPLKPLNSDKPGSQKEVTKNVQTEEVRCKQPDRVNKAKIKKPIPHISKGLQMYMENQNILDSLSHLFIKTKLTSILDFLTDELCDSKIFTNLAPIESRFLENFLSIYQRKDDFEGMLSPACHEILTEISNYFKDFSKTRRLDISCVGVNSSTNIREVKYTKVPVIPGKKKAKQKLKSSLTQSKTSEINQKKVENTSSISKEKNKMAVEEKVSKETKKVCEDICGKREPIGKVIETIDKNVIKALSTFVKKADDVKPKTTTYLKDTSVNKSVLLPKKSISFTKEGTSSPSDTTYTRVERKSPKMKILQDMTVPLNIDKAARMMQLMGWKGGALGIRGDGITEPIIPTPNFNTCGLGHVAVKKDSNKETKNNLRSEFLNKIYKMIDNDIKVSVIKVQNKLNKRETRFWKLTIRLINERMNLDAEFEKRLEIRDMMLKNMDIMFNIDFEDENRKIIITKTSQTAMKINQNTSKDTNAEETDINAMQNKTSEATFKTIVLKSILVLIKSEDNEIVIQFDKDLKTKHIQYSHIIILLINERHYVQQKNSPVVAELGQKILEAIGDILLSVKIYESDRCIVVRKKNPKSNDSKIIKTVVNKAESDEHNKSAFDNVRSYLPLKKKHKILNALYQYEMEYTEEFQENQWYKTVDKSLLESDKTVTTKTTE